MNNKQNPLAKYFFGNRGRMIDKWVHYFDIYDRHFHKHRKKQITVLEFGVQNGGSAQMWKKYFGKKTQIIGVDIDERCKAIEEQNIKIFIGDQEDRKFLKDLMKKVGPVDIVIDDGGHTMKQQINTFEEVYPFVKTDGVYLVEDTHTSYWKEFGGGYKKTGSFMEYAKNSVDQLNAWHSREDNKLKVDNFTRTTKGVSFYDSVVVFEKGVIEKPKRKTTGTKSF